MSSSDSAWGHGTTEPRLTDVPEVRAGMVAGCLFVVTPLGERLHVGVDLAMAVVVVATLGVALTGSWAVLVAATGWGLVTGFVVNSSGTLTFGEHDLIHLAVVGGATAVAPLVRTNRLARHSHQHAAVDALHP